MSRFKHLAPAVIAMGAFLACATATFGKAEYTKKEKKACIACHTKSNSKELNDVGKCYDKAKSLANCTSEKK